MIFELKIHSYTIFYFIVFNQKLYKFKGGATNLTMMYKCGKIEIIFTIMVMRQCA